MWRWFSQFSRAWIFWCFGIFGESVWINRFSSVPRACHESLQPGADGGGPVRTKKSGQGLCGASAGGKGSRFKSCQPDTLQVEDGSGEIRSRLFCLRAAGVSPACPGDRLEFVGYELAEV